MKGAYTICWRVSDPDRETDLFSSDWEPIDEHTHKPVRGAAYAVRNPDGVLIRRNITFPDALECAQRLRRTATGMTH